MILVGSLTGLNSILKVPSMVLQIQFATYSHRVIGATSFLQIEFVRSVSKNCHNSFSCKLNLQNHLEFSCTLDLQGQELSLSETSNPFLDNFHYNPSNSLQALLLLDFLKYKKSHYSSLFHFLYKYRNFLFPKIDQKY